MASAPGSRPPGGGGPTRRALRARAGRVPGTDGPGSLVVGVDEAGRGSLLGPLVVGAFVLPRDRLPALVATGVRDSKLLTPAARTAIYRRLAGVGRRLSVALDPATIDRYVHVGGLNDLEARAFGQLVRRAGAPLAYVDACDPVPARFGRAVARWAGGDPTIVARHRADATFPVVAAASIVAKVRRDRALERLRGSVGAEVGSGYPSDARTVSFVRGLLRDGGPVPPWVRRSWRTMGRLMPPASARTLESFDR